MRTTTQVIDNHLKCFNDGDLDGILADYAPGAVLFTPEATLRGHGAIRDLFVAMLGEFGQPGTRFELEKRAVDGDHGYILWKAETADQVYELGTDTFFIQDGRIAVQSFAARTGSKG
ncbi:MAG: nuclear transport factor 2 family protein [Burkholderiaceae bacterium]|nr:nuclear transport factor 2 family protein [Burkholderiaceae bacterium]